MVLRTGMDWHAIASRLGLPYDNRRFAVHRTPYDGRSTWIGRRSFQDAGVAASVVTAKKKA